MDDTAFHIPQQDLFQDVSRIGTAKKSDLPDLKRAMA
ncbi:hypothetical protein P775_23605 [Puniceibacterium antarcticum]|uniref:Uncharacterized protein n=1 Tax=Puniceibacterium antarcticum TaxID=1206336 RepID=A0A2G8R849_9RHOB|nr:hypothetical protein P775_23605 [Puniceibacterium antarcticum]